MKNRSGITFIELIIVIMIIGLVTAMTMPNFIRMIKSTKTGSAARKMAGYMKYLRDKTVRENRQFILVFDLYSNRYWTATELREEEMPPEYWYASEQEKMEMRFPAYVDKDGFLKPVQLEDGITIPEIFNEEGDRFTTDFFNAYYRAYFYPDGTATASAIYIKGQGEEIMTIIIKPFTGKIEISEGYKIMAARPELYEDD